MKLMHEDCFRSSVLPNGLRVVSEEIPYVRSVSVGVWVNLGSRMEDKSLNGISHLIEHMLFKGTNTVSADALTVNVDSIGAHIGASTNREYTCIHLRVLDEHLPTALHILADILLHTRFGAAELEKEKKVILKEIKMFEDSSDSLIYDLYAKEFWKDHSLGQPIAGTKETLMSFSRGDILKFFKTFYTAKNTIISVAGNFDYNKMMDSVSGLFSTMTSGSRAVTYAPELPVANVASYGKDIEQVHICLGTKGLPQNHEARFPSYILELIIGGGISSRLFRKLRIDRGLCYSIHSYFSSFSDSGTFAIYCATGRKHFREVIPIILEELRSLKDKELAAEEFQMKKARLKGNLMLNMESTSSRMIYLAKQAMYFDKSQSLCEIISAIDGVLPSDVRALANSLFQSKFINLVLLGKVDLPGFAVSDIRC